MNTLTTRVNNDHTQNVELQLNGQCGYQITEDRVLINIESIANQRTLDNLSGTLAIQLRAYRKGNELEQQSCLLASTEIGQISGQYYLPNCLYDLIYTAPNAGIWDLALELREWNGEDYILRDAVNFELPLHIEFHPSLIDNVVEMPSIKTESKTESEETSSVERVEKTEESSPVKATQKTTKKKTKTSDESELSVINQCSSDEILKVKGLSKKVAKEIVQNRPFKKWKELLDVKGVGPKLLEKIRKALKG